MSDETYSAILKAIKAAGIWYELPNYEPLTFEEIREQFPQVGDCPTFSRLQRQCDAIAIE